MPDAAPAPTLLAAPASVLRPRAAVYVDLAYLRGQNREWHDASELVGRADTAPKFNYWAIINSIAARYDVHRVDVFDGTPIDGSPPAAVALHRVIRSHPFSKLHLIRGQRGPDQEQKGVDTALTLAMAADATAAAVSHMVIVTGDSDFVPLLDFARQKGIHVTLAAFLQSRSLRELRMAASDVLDLDHEPIVMLRWIPGAPK